MGTFAETAIIHYRLSLPTRKNKCPFSISVCSKQTKVCHVKKHTAVAFFQKFHFPFAEFWKRGDIEISSVTRKMEAQAIFCNLFTNYSSCKWKFVCPFVDEVTHGTYPFANRLNILNELDGLAHLCHY